MVLLLLMLMTARAESPCAYRSARYAPKDYSNYCELANAYERALSRLRAQGVERPERIANLIAPRLLQLRDWRETLDRSPDANPWLVYEPAPTTWGNWEKAAEWNRARRRSPWTLEELRRAHTRIMGTPSRLRDGPVIGRAWERRHALKSAHVANLPTLEYGSRRLVRWRDTTCLEDRDEEFQRAYQDDRDEQSRPEAWPVTDAREFVDEQGVARRCGYVEYAETKNLRRDLAAWSKGFGKLDDPVLAAARAERWLVAIHPFDGGNGRVARFVMERILGNAGLPPPILENMDDDLGSTEDEWASAVGEGMARSIRVLEHCAQFPGARGCQEIPSAPHESCPFSKARNCWSADSCNGYGVCLGEWAYAQTGATITRGRVQRVYPTGAVRLAGRDFDVDEAAVSRAGECFGLTGPICVGAATRRGKVVGYFPISGDLLVRDGRLRRVPAAEVAVSPTPDLLNQEMAARPAPPRRESRDCRNPQMFGRDVRLNEQGELLASCAPDTLYSWMPADTLRGWRERFERAAWPRLIGERLPLFTVRDPVSTFGYGSFDHSGGFSVRLRLKDGVKFKLWGVNRKAPDCAKLPAAEVDDTVFVHLWGGPNPARSWGEYSVEEFMVCSSRVIRSWSWGTPQNYDEIVAALKYTTVYEHWDSFARYLGSPRLLGLNSDGHPFTRAQLLASLLKAKSARGGVYPADANHFK